MEMSSESFELLAEELQNLCETIERRIDKKFTGSPFGEARKLLIQELQRDFEECSRFLQQMESECRQAPHPYRSELMSTLRKHREDVSRLRSRFNKAMAHVERNSELTDPRRVVLEGRNVLERTSDSISRSTAVAIETEQIGNEVVGELGTQREALLRTKTRLVDTDVEISKSRKILRSMYINMIYNKLILIGIIILEVGIIGVICYIKFK